MDSLEQAKIAKLGLEMKLITSEMESEAERWNLPENEIIKTAKLMSSIAYKIHLFTRGEGSLRSVNDLFRKAEQFLQFGSIFYNLIREFLDQLPAACNCKCELNGLADKLPHQFQLLRNRLKQVSIGKTATFNKVDYVIQELRDFMNLVSKITTLSFVCGSKFQINFEKLGGIKDPNNNTRNPHEKRVTYEDIEIYGTSSLTDSLPMFCNSNQTESYLFAASNNNNNNRNSRNLMFDFRTNNNRSDSCGPSFHKC